MASYGLTGPRRPWKLARVIMACRLCLAPAALVLLSSVLLGCGVDLPECDIDRARTPAFGLDVRMAVYEGQALMVRSCGSGQFCHAPRAAGGSRFGAPAGLDFDLRPVVQSSSGARSDRAFDRLETSQIKVHNNRHSIAEQVVRGFMPPGEVGDQRRDRDGLSFVRDVKADGVGDPNTPLPEIDTKEGRQVLKNWLACGSPVVMEHIPPPEDGSRAIGEHCEPSVPREQAVGECVVHARVDPPESTWTSIYERVIEPSCVPCHQPGTPEGRTSGLELLGADMAHERLVEDGEVLSCADDEAADALVVRGDAEASRFFRKLQADPGCGSRMPLRAPPLPDDFLAPIRAWIDGGAEND